MSSFALFRYPFSNTATLIMQSKGDTRRLTDYEEIGNEEGFVVAPFCKDKNKPGNKSQENDLLLIKADEKIDIKLSQIHSNSHVQQCLKSVSLQEITSEDTNKEDYMKDFFLCKDALQRGDFRKIVLARSKEIKREGNSCKEEASHLLNLFRIAAESYPRVMVALVSTPESGTWLFATPEILVEHVGNEWHTMALAGTMNYEEGAKWSDKNIQEQRLVASYIDKQLRPITQSIKEEGPVSARAGSLVHLRSDFTFNLCEEKHIGDVIASLHPTPAICGLPKEDSLGFILEKEHCHRSYYSGFIGYTSDSESHLFVSLRCMQIFSNAYRLYAGGGLLKESEADDEWNETKEKMKMMEFCIQNARKV